MDKRIVWIFDNDCTLYNVPSEFEKAIFNRIIKQLTIILGKTKEKVHEMREELCIKYKSDTTIAAFILEGIILNFDEFVKKTYLSIVPKEHGIQEDRRLQEMIKQLPGQKYILTNNPKDFADKISRVLGIRNLFDDIFGIENVDFRGKPERSAFEKVLKCFPLADVFIYVDDNAKNVCVASDIGLIGVKVGTIGTENCNIIIPSIYNLSFETISASLRHAKMQC